MISGTPTWSKEIVYQFADNYFRDLLSAIAASEKSIEMESYIFEPGLLGNRVCTALAAASQRGVAVRLLIDGIGSPAFTSEYEPLLRAAGVKVRYYRIWPWILRRLPGEPRWWLGKLLYRIARLNKGDHRKMILIDRTTLWVGSANISDVHLREVHGDQAWHDLSVCVAGPEVDFAFRAFERAFKRGRPPRPSFKMPNLLVINKSFLQKRRQRAVQVRRLGNAKERIWIQTPYFVPLTRVLRRLATKARNGVDVRILIPKNSDVWMIPWISHSYLVFLRAAGAKVYQYGDGFLHQKLYIIDDWICVGSTNLDHRSFLHDLEIDVVITHPENKALLEQGFEKDLQASETFPTEGWSSLSPLRRLFYWMTAYFSYWA